MRLINRAIDMIINFMAGVATMIMGFLLISICYATFSRFVFNEPIARTVELAAYSLIYITFLSAPWLLKQRGHVSVDVILLFLGKRAKKTITLITDIVGMLISFVLFYYSYLVTLDNYISKITIMDSSNTPQYLLLIAIPISFIFLGIQFIRFIKEDITALVQEKGGKEQWNGI